MAAHRKSDRRRDDLCGAGLRKRASTSWTRHFVEEMERLAAPLLRQSGNGADLRKTARDFSITDK